jgi:hypothetical protein
MVNVGSIGARIIQAQSWQTKVAQGGIKAMPLQSTAYPVVNIKQGTHYDISISAGADKAALTTQLITKIVAQDIGLTQTSLETMTSTLTTEGRTQDEIINAVIGRAAQCSADLSDFYFGSMASDGYLRVTAKPVADGGLFPDGVLLSDARTGMICVEEVTLDGQTSDARTLGGKFTSLVGHQTPGIQTMAADLKALDASPEMEKCVDAQLLASDPSVQAGGLLSCQILGASTNGTLPEALPTEIQTQDGSVYFGNAIVTRDACDIEVGAVQAQLDTSTAELGTCNTDLTARTGELGTCTTDLTARTGELGTCTTDLTARTGELGTCTADLTARTAELETSIVDLGNCTTARLDDQRLFNSTILEERAQFNITLTDVRTQCATDLETAATDCAIARGEDAEQCGIEKAAIGAAGGTTTLITGVVAGVSGVVVGVLGFLGIRALINKCRKAPALPPVDLGIV